MNTIQVTVTVTGNYSVSYVIAKVVILDMYYISSIYGVFNYLNYVTVMYTEKANLMISGF